MVFFLSQNNQQYIRRIDGNSVVTVQSELTTGFSRLGGVFSGKKINCTVFKEDAVLFDDLIKLKILCRQTLKKLVL